MADDALIEWLEAGAKPKLTAEEDSARRCAEFAQRFVAAHDADDQGPTEELHEAAVARLVYEVHADLNVLGEVEYSAVWALLPASSRRAIKHYVAVATKESV